MYKKSQFLRKVKFSKKTMQCALVFLIISLITMSLAYAALSTTLTIRGTTRFDDVTWNITITELTEKTDWNYTGNIDGNVYYKGDAKVIKKPTINGTNITDYKVSLVKPGDEIYLLYKITNNGNVPAILEDIYWGDPIFSSDTNNEQDITLLKKKFDWDYDLYRITKNGDIWEYDDRDFGSGSILCPGETLELDVYNSFSSTATSVSSSNITISNVDASFYFVAMEDDVCNP